MYQSNVKYIQSMKSEKGKKVNQSHQQKQSHLGIIFFFFFFWLNISGYNEGFMVGWKWYIVGCAKKYCDFSQLDGIPVEMG